MSSVSNLPNTPLLSPHAPSIVQGPAAAAVPSPANAAGPAGAHAPAAAATPPIAVRLMGPRAGVQQPGHGAHGHDHHHAHGAHAGHGHDGGMTAVVLDLDEVLAFVAPRVTGFLAPLTNGLARAGARGVNGVLGAGSIRPAQAARAGAHMAQAGGLATIGLGIWYASHATHHAHASAHALDHEANGWRTLLAPEPAANDQGGLASAYARGLRANRLPEASVKALVDEACVRASAARSGCRAKHLASAAAAAMAATLLFSADFLLTPLVAALAPLSGIALGIAIPVMGAYGLWSAFESIKVVYRGAQTWRALHSVADTMHANDKAALEQHLNRYGWGLVWEGLSAAGGVMLAAGLGLQLVNGAVGIALLAVGSLGLELFATLRTQSHGVWLPEAAARSDAPGQAQDLRAAFTALHQLSDAKHAVCASRPSRLGVLTGLYFACSRAGGDTALRQRTMDLLGQLGWSSAPALANEVGHGPAVRALADALSELGLDEAFEAELGLADASWTAGLPQAHPSDSMPRKRGFAVARRRELQARLAEADLRGPAACAAAYRAGLKVLWGPGSDRLLLAYGEARATTFARLAAGEPLNVAAAT